MLTVLKMFSKNWLLLSCNVGRLWDATVTKLQWVIACLTLEESKGGDKEEKILS